MDTFAAISASHVAVCAAWRASSSDVPADMAAA
jgi:hypothetical protein